MTRGAPRWPFSAHRGRSTAPYSESASAAEHAATAAAASAPLSPFAASRPVAAAFDRRSRCSFLGMPGIPSTASTNTTL